MHSTTASRTRSEGPFKPRARLAIGDYGQARIHYAEALALASQIGDQYHQACAHDGLARIHQADADLEQARDHWRQALALYAEIGTPDVGQIRIRLAAGLRDHMP